MRKRPSRRSLHFILTASLGLVVTTATSAMPSFGDWSSPASIESLPGSSTEINSPAIDGCASISPDGLTVAFNSLRTGNQEIYLATRTDTSEGFGDPVILPSPINTSEQEFCPTLTHDKRLYFSSSRGGGLGTGDLYVTRLGPNGWTDPEKLGTAINSPDKIEEAASFYEDDEGRKVMVFSRRPPGPLFGPGQHIYQSIDGAPATLVAGGPHSSSSDARPSVTHDGRTIFWDSTRSGSQGNDIWYATRSNTSEPWGQAIHLLELSSSGLDLRPFINWDGYFLTMSSDRTGSESSALDIWFSARKK